MRHFKKTLLILPLVLLLFGCSKKTQRTSKETKTTLTNTTKITTLKTTSQAITTEDEFRDISVVKNIDEAGSVKGDGIFNPNSSTTIQITLNYGYEFVGLYNGKTKLTDELTYEISNITESLILDAIFKPIKYEISVEKDIDEAATITGVGSFDYKSDTTISIELDNEYLFLGLYDNDDNKVSEDLTYDIKNISDDVTLYAKFKQKTYDVIINQSLENAATITGSGSFVKGCNTTITITTNDYYTYKGLYDENNNLLTEELTYEITNITKPITLNALFDGTIFSFKSYSYEEFLGDATTIDDTFECGSKIELEAEPVEGYEVDGWYVNGEFYSDEAKFTYIMPTKDVEIYAKFRIKEFKITIIDNIEGLGEYYIGDNLYDEDVTYEYGLSVWVDIYSVKGYDFDHYTIDGEEYTYSYAELLMEDNITIYVYYELADMFFYLSFDDTLLQSNNSIYIDILPKDYEAGTNYIYGYYTYKTVINISLNVKTNYYLNGLTSDNDESYTYTMDNDVITLTILDDYNDIIIDILGKIVTLRVEAYDDVEGYTTLGGEFHYGETVNIKAYPNKGYKFSKWVDENGNPYAHSYDAHHYVDYYPNDVDVKLDGDATYIAVFEPDEFDCHIHLVARNASRNVDYYVLTYLTEYDIHAPNVSGYTFAGWLENEDMDTLFSTDEVLHYTMINEESTIYAYYTPNSYTVTLNLDGGECSETSKTLVMGDNFTVEIPTKENLHFNGYYYYHTSETHYYDNDSTQLVYFIARIFNCNPADADGIIERGVVYVNDVLVTNSSTMVYRDDKVTIGDYLSGVKVVDKDGKSENVYIYPFDATFIAIWDALIIKKSNNGAADKEYNCELGKTISRFDTPERTGYTFKGWYVGDELYDFNSVVEHNLIIEAKWEIINYTVLYDSNNPSFGEITSTHSTAHYGDEVTLTFTAGDIYTFEYWYNRDTKEKIYSETITFIMPASDVRYRAYATAFYLLVKTNDDSWGSVEKDSIVARAGAELTLKAIPAEGYGFDHWEYEGEAFSTNAETTFIMPDSALSRVTAVFGKEITDKYERLGNKIWFGYYPQTCLNPNGQSGSNSALITELENIAGGFPTLDTKAHYEETQDNTNWINYDYEIYPNEKDWYKSEQKVNYETYQTYWEHTYYKAPHMWYIDIDYDEDGRFDYRGVLIYSYRNDEINKEKSSTNTDSTHQDDNHFDRSIVYNTYWFKYELIEWDVLENNDGTVKLIADLAIDSQNFSLSSNSYASSYIRDFLNDDFYNTAFNDLEKSIMNAMTIGSNNDFVTILTQEEATSYFENNADRTTQPTDYAMSQNCYVYSSPNIYNPTNDGNCYWLTRSAYTESGKIYYINYAGTVANGKTNMTYYGIRPVITITL